MARRFNRKPLSDEQRDTRRQANRDRIEQAARALLTAFSGSVSGAPARERSVRNSRCPYE
jgi:hypothetical protein